MSKSLIRKKLPKAPPKSPVRSIAQLSDADFKKFKNKVLKLTTTMGPMRVAGLFRDFNLFRETKGAKGIDPNKYYRNEEIAEQLLPMMEAEVKRRRKGKRAMKKKTVGKKAGQRVGTANYPGKKKVQPTPEELKGMKKKTAKKKSGGSVGTHNRLY